MVACAAVIAWLLTPVLPGRPVPNERLLLEHLSAMAGVLKRC